jgi:hypothetical protein
MIAIALMLITVSVVIAAYIFVMTKLIAASDKS